MTSERPADNEETLQAGANRRLGQAQAAVGADAEMRANASDMTTMRAIADADTGVADRPGAADPNDSGPPKNARPAASNNASRQAGGDTNAGGSAGDMAAGATSMATGLAGAGVGAAVGTVFGPLGLVTGAIAGAVLGAAAPGGTQRFDNNNTALTGSALFEDDTNERDSKSE